MTLPASAMFWTTTSCRWRCLQIWIKFSLPVRWSSFLIPALKVQPVCLHGSGPLPNKSGEVGKCPLKSKSRPGRKRSGRPCHCAERVLSYGDRRQRPHRPRHCGAGGGTPRISKELLQNFQEKCGATICKDLKGIENGAPLCPCPECVRNAVLALGEVLGE